MSLQIGDAAPDFSLPDQNGEPVSLASLRGKKVVLYFYPKDDTPGCTKEACNFRDRWDQLKANNITVLGISKDGATSHSKFINKHELPFTLLTDVEPCAVASLYELSLIHISEPTRLRRISYAVFCLKKKKK